MANCCRQFSCLNCHGSPTTYGNRKTSRYLHFVFSPEVLKLWQSSRPSCLQNPLWSCTGYFNFKMTGTVPTEKEVVETTIHLENALSGLDISAKEADEAFAFLKDHPNADGVTQEAIAILSTEQGRKKLLRKIDRAILPCMIVTYFLQFLDKVKCLHL